MVAKRNLKESSRAVSSVVGLLLMYSLAIIAVGIILVYNVPVLNDMQDSAKAQKIEQGFTVLDSRISKVALGEAPLQTTSVSLMGGEINVNGPGEAEKGTMIIKIINHSNHTEQINCSLGTIEYVKDDRKIAYEGGGVWSDYGSKGGIVMVSPPEFHYNLVTLTIPIMSIKGNTSVSGTGNTAIVVTSNNQPNLLYPNESINRSNPLVDYDEVEVHIKSDYYKGWANYANSLTGTSALLDDENKTAILTFTTRLPNGTYPLMKIIPVSMIDPEPLEPIEEFSFKLDAASANELNSVNAELKATSEIGTLTYLWQKRGGNNQYELEVIYEDAINGTKEIWESIDVYPVIGDKEGATSTVDLTNRSFMVKYKHTADTEFSWDQPGPTTELPDVEIKEDDPYSINDLTQHYMKLITKNEPIKFELTTHEYNSNNVKPDPVDYTTSTYTLKYKGLGNYITYLHITQNELDVTVE
ncbi:hypothetical protein [Methanococcoides methylutens]|uniref:DUF7308 domain-containing protein n=1 Tax=Methanococcoides methylutens MM1 TaxID=1434104 RepID=A0A0E3ST78_METMT|nr:hypothetical protein [Methanococcoides methylutens]AKB85757.1 hypothetical protein MCMEM_1704 [Methanococcoides methylutens MM1]